MKKLVVLAALLVSPMAFAFDGMNVPSDYPTNSQWAIGMVENACRIDLDANEVTGTITETKGGVVYRIYNSNGQVVAAAKAKSTFILAKKVCLVK